MNDTQLLQMLAACPVPPARPQSFLSAVRLERRELPISMWLAWLLSPRGPLSDDRLLRLLIAFVDPDRDWFGPPLSVDAELAVDSERADIVIEWPDYRLVVECKVDSREGDAQLERYLRAYAIQSSSQGRIVYLTPTGIASTTVDHDDDRVIPMSFASMIRLLDEVVGTEVSERGRVFAHELSEGMRQIINRSRAMAKQIKISESTVLWAREHDRLDKLMKAACEEARDVVEATHERIHARLTEVFDAIPVVCSEENFGYATYGKPEWKRAGTHYGIAFGVEGKLGSIPFHRFKPTSGVRLPQLDGVEVSARDRRALATSLHSVIEPQLSELAEFRPGGPNQWFAVWMDLKPLRQPEHWEQWASGVVDAVSRIAADLTPILDRYAAKKER